MTSPHNFTPENDLRASYIDAKRGRVARLLLNHKAFTSLMIDNIDAMRAEAPKMERHRLKQVAKQHEALLEKEVSDAYDIMGDNDVFFAQFANVLQAVSLILIKATVDDKLTDFVSLVTAWEKGEVRVEGGLPTPEDVKRWYELLTGYGEEKMYENMKELFKNV